MAFPVPRSLSPSKVSAFTDCALAFRFSVIDRLPEPPSPAAVKGTLVHAALERLHLLAPADRTVEAGLACLDAAVVDLRTDPEFVELALPAEAEAEFLADAAVLVRNYFQIEDPTRVRAIGLELMMEAELDGVTLRGIIDRLDLDDDGELIVTDYKTGASPSERYERKRLSGVHIYSLLCEQLIGKRPKRVQLLYLRDPLALLTEPSNQSTRGTRRTLGAVWQAVERACEREDFRHRSSRLCDYCAFQAWCPAFGGDPAAAPIDNRLPFPSDPASAGSVTAGPVTAGPVTAGPVTAEPLPPGPGPVGPDADRTPVATERAAEATPQPTS